MTDKKYPEDFTPEQQEIIKDTVIERIKRLPDNFRISMGRKIEDEGEKKK